MKNETHAILAAHLVPSCPHAELFNGPGRAWLARQVLPDDERAAIECHLRELDRLGADMATLDRDIGVAVVDQPAVRRLLTIAGVNVTVAAGLVAAIGDIRRFSSPQKLVSYFGLDPRVRQSGSASPNMAGSARSAGHTRGPFWSKRLGRPPRRRVPRTVEHKALVDLIRVDLDAAVVEEHVWRAARLSGSGTTAMKRRRKADNGRARRLKVGFAKHAGLTDTKSAGSGC